MWKNVHEIRQAFLNFFREKQHTLVSSAPLIVRNDPSLMFINAGMNPFKDYFLGHRQPVHRRIANTQRCLRVSGKHNDLEEVGIDTYHHTFFEMLGNWSFGDPTAADGIGQGYFKKEAIAWAWELLTRVYGISEDRLYVTVFAGDADESLPVDEEAAECWRAHVRPERILLGSKKDNFWEMGESGPCGPCSEIHVDTRSEVQRTTLDGASLVNTGHPDVIEIWNLVFIQYNRLQDGQLQPLSARHVDTGMGLERLARVLQNKPSNYDTDLFVPTLTLIETLTQTKYGSDPKTDIAMRVQADHIRAISFAIADGQLPSNTGAGYVIRRILRRAVRYYYSYLKRNEPLLCYLVPQLAQSFQTVFPELQRQQDFVVRVIEEEETSFLKTLGAGLRRLAQVETTLSTQNPTLGGDVAFELYDTYGFPFDLTKLIAKEKHWSVDEATFHRLLDQQKLRSRKATEISSGDWIEVRPAAPVVFTGYHQLEAKAHLLRYRQQQSKDKLWYQLVLDRTPFYAESGGQVGDTGWLIAGDESVNVFDTRKENEFIVHFVERLPQKLDDEMILRVDSARRYAIMNNHTATHLLHAALRQCLGSHVQQRGSLVVADYLRFDFSHFAKLSADEWDQIEQVVNEKIRENVSCEVEELPYAEALASGAIALFGEKYGDYVRVVSFDRHFSRELCGGTHVASTGSLGLFKIVSETAVAAGIRRIEAVTGKAALQFVQQAMHQWQSMRQALGSDPLKGLAQLQSELSRLKSQVTRYEQQVLAQQKQHLVGCVLKTGSLSVIAEPVQVDSVNTLKKLCMDLRDAFPCAAIALGAQLSSKAHLAVLITPDATHCFGLDAAQLIQTMGRMIEGAGGGKTHFATAGGRLPAALPNALKWFKQTVTEAVNTSADRQK